MWREWIEISELCKPTIGGMSPSVWREWIEMSLASDAAAFWESPSVWREWIEISVTGLLLQCPTVSLRVEGVD